LSISPPSEIKTDRRLTFGYLGRLEPAKGIEALLIAFQRLAAPNARLLIAGRGDGRYENELRSRFDSKNIKFLGFCSPHDFFRQVDILVTPSLLHEGLGRTIIEAYAHGVPVIGSNRGGIPEIIEDGKTGFIFDPDHLETLIIQMRKVIDGLFDLSEMAQQARIKAEEFHPDRIADAYLKLYTQVCRGRSVLAA
jgi:glycosyltransferase involved in cell wall biosynthesis